MKNIFLAILLFILSIFGANAETIRFVTPYNPGGGGYAVSQVLASELKQRGWNIDHKDIGNCAIVKTEFVETKNPTILLWENNLSADKLDKCFIEIKETQFVSYLTSSPNYICVRPDSGIAAEDLFTKPLKMNISPDVYSLRAFHQLKTLLGNPNLKTVVYTNSGAARTAFVAGEIDIFYGTNAVAIMKEKQGVCFYNTGATELNGTKPISSVLPKKFEQYFAFMLLSNNLSTTQQEKLRTDLKEIKETKAWKDATARYSAVALKDKKDEYQFIMDTLPKE